MMDDISLGQLNANDPSLTCLTIGPDDFGENEDSAAENRDHFTAVQAALQGNSFLEEMEVCNIPIPNTFLPAVFALYNLRSLKLECVGLTQQNVTQANNSEIHLSKLQSLSLANNPKLGPRGCQGLKPLLKLPQLRELNLKNIGMGHYGAQGMEFPGNLESLNLSRNILGIDGIWKLSLPVDTLLELDISHNGCMDDGCIGLAKIIPTQLRLLNISFNSIGTRGLEVLAKALQNHEHIQQLNVSNNRIEQVNGLAELLAMRNEANDLDGSWVPLSKSSIRALDVSYNQIESCSCLMLAGALRNNTCLRELNLSHNLIDDEGAGEFVDILDDNTELRFLDLSRNNAISDARLRILEMLLKHRGQRSESVSDASMSLVTTHATTLPNTEFKCVTEDKDEIPDAEKDLVQKGSTFLRSCLQAKDLKCTTNDKTLHSFLSNATKKFDIRSVISRGAFGSLYQLEDESFSDSLYVRRKDLRGGHSRKEAVLQDIRQFHQQLSNHDYIASIVACACTNDSFCFVYNLSDAVSLAGTLQTNGASLTWTLRVKVLRALVSVLQYLHSQGGGEAGNFHGDLSPHNVYISRGGGGKDLIRIKVLDCFLTRLPTADPIRWIAGDVIYGTRGYRCPRYERGSCRYDSSSDMFSLGIMVAELMTGRLQASKNNGSMAWDVYYDCVLARRPLIVDPLLGNALAGHLFAVLGKIVGMCANPDIQQRPPSSFISTLLDQLEQEMM